MLLEYEPNQDLELNELETDEQGAMLEEYE